MRFLFDVCAASRRMQRALERRGHDVRSAVDINPRATDHDILSWATAEQRVLVTEDKDFGELVFVRRLPHACIVRFVEMTVDEKIAAMIELVERHQDAMHAGSMIVVTRSRVRIRE